ncbi:hypothetical protein GCM10023185_46760 [Hymenobacter saemangeumensis]|uniref:Uncharacterized protein n=1 Tax=Hymenobacter saemangeumensis TaxID=1084522 RepID=A0ABP8IT32_9BACT
MQKIVPVLRLIAGILLAGSYAGQAQDMREIRGVAQLPQVLPLDDQGYAVFYRSEAGEDGQDVYAMRLLDPALTVRHRYALNVPVGAAELPRLAGKTTFALPFHDQGAALLSLYTFNPQTGAQLRRDLAAAPDRRRMPTGTPLLTMTPTEGFCVVQPFRRDTAGYTVTVLDKDLKTQWSKMYFPKDLRQHVPLQVAVSKDLITLVLADSYVLNPNTKQQRSYTDMAVLGLDRNTGQVLYRTPVRDEKRVLMPTRLLALSDGRVAATGLYAMPQAPRPDSVLGVFLTYYRPDGPASTPVLTPWAELGARLGEPALARRLYDSKASFQVHELLSTTGTDVKLVGEYTAAQPGPFVVFNYSAAGALGSLYTVARTFKSNSNADELRYSRYYHVIGKQGEPYLVYTGVEGGQPYTYSTLLAESPARTATRATTSIEALPELPVYTTETPMARSAAVDRFSGKIMGMQQKLGTVVQAADKVVNGTPPPTPVYYRPDQLANFVVGPPGQVLVYRYEPGRKMLRYSLQPMK